MSKQLTQVQELSAIIAAHLSQDAGAIKYDAAAGWQAAMAHHGVTQEQVNKVRTLDNQYAAAFTHASGMYCNQVSQGNPEVREVFLEAAMPAFEGDGTKAHVTWRRESQVIAGIPKTGEEPKKKTKYGATETGLVYHEQGKTTLSQVRKDVSADATSRLQDAAVEAAMS